MFSLHCKTRGSCEEICVIRRDCLGLVANCKDVKSGKSVVVNKRPSKPTRWHCSLWGDVALDDSGKSPALERLKGEPLRVHVHTLLRTVHELHQSNVVQRDLLPPSGSSMGPTSPEWLLGDAHGKPSDIWTVGCCILAAARGVPALGAKEAEGERGEGERGEGKRAAVDAIVRCVGPLTPWQEHLYFRMFGESAVLPLSTRSHRSLCHKYGLADGHLAALVDCCLQMEPASRVTCAQLLQHPYFHSAAALRPALQWTRHTDATLWSVGEGASGTEPDSSQRTAVVTGNKKASSGQRVERRWMNRSWRAIKRCFTQISFSSRHARGDCE